MQFGAAVFEDTVFMGGHNGAPVNMYTLQGSEWVRSADLAVGTQWIRLVEFDM
jgi:hypothetical protein